LAIFILAVIYFASIVFEIMVKWLDTRDWEKAFMDVIPGRKLKESTLLKEGEDGNQDDDDGEEEEEEDDKEDDKEDQAKESDE
jgi:tRNA (guanine9-N1)-methyltransferase